MIVKILNQFHVFNLRTLHLSEQEDKLERKKTHGGNKRKQNQLAIVSL